MAEIRSTPEQTARNRELSRRQEIRSSFLVPIYVTWTSDVPRPEAQAALQGVEDALKSSGQNRRLVVLDKPWGQGPFSSADWYVQETYRRQDLRRDVGFGPQLSAGFLNGFFYKEPWQEKPHWEVFILNHDLNNRGRNFKYINFVFGSTDTGFPSSVQSVRRLMTEVSDPAIRQIMVRRLLRHEVGHMFGLPDPQSPHTKESLGTHCTNLCSMRQGLNIPEWMRHTREEFKSGVLFCSDCMNYLARGRDRFKPLPRPR